MGTLFSTLDIARSGMQVSTIQMSTAGHNIANVSKEGFSRQRVELAARIPLHMPFGKIGRGVEIMGINRVRDIFLDKVYRQTAPRLGEAEVQAQFYSRIEDVFLEPDEGGFGQNFEYFFNSLNDLANNVEQFPVRKSVLVEAQSLASSLNEVAERLAVLRSGAMNIAVHPRDSRKTA